MKFIDLNEDYRDMVIELAIEGYKKELSFSEALSSAGYRDTIIAEVDELLECSLGTLLLDDDESLMGYIAFWGVFEDKKTGYRKTYSPFSGYGISPNIEDRGKIISLLFQEAASKLIQEDVCSYSMKVYAHDNDVIQSYVLNQFGIESTEVIRKTSDQILIAYPSECVFRLMSSRDLDEYKSRLLNYWGDLRTHLRQSPTFYPGIEFTDDLYSEHISHPDTRVYGAFMDGEIIGMVDASIEVNSFVNDNPKIINMGDLFVADEYRGTGIAQGLLDFSFRNLEVEGYSYAWVEHGTTNPTSTRFWDKYFDNYSYTMTREIDPKVLAFN